MLLYIAIAIILFLVAVNFLKILSATKFSSIKKIKPYFYLAFAALIVWWALRFGQSWLAGAVLFFVILCIVFPKFRKFIGL